MLRAMVRRRLTSKVGVTVRVVPVPDVSRNRHVDPCTIVSSMKSGGVG